jgi:hypothetical protein
MLVYGSVLLFCATVTYSFARITSGTRKIMYFYFSRGCTYCTPFVAAVKNDYDMGETDPEVAACTVVSCAAVVMLLSTRAN